MTDTPITDYLLHADEGVIDYASDAYPVVDDTGDDTEALKQADWHLRYIARLQRDLDLLNAVYEAELHRLRERWEERHAALQRKIDWHAKPVTELHAALLQRDGHRKTIDLPHGTMRARVPAKPRVEVMDEDAFIGWARIRDEERGQPLGLVRNEWHVVKAKVADQLTAKDGRWMDPESGEIVPGIAAVLPPPQFSVQVDDG